MTRQVRSWAIAALAVFALAGAAAPSFAGVIYNVTNDLTHQDGWSLAGTITVSGVGTFTSASDIAAFDITASKDSVSHRFSNTLVAPPHRLRWYPPCDLDNPEPCS